LSENALFFGVLRGLWVYFNNWDLISTFFVEVKFVAQIELKVNIFCNE